MIKKDTEVKVTAAAAEAKPAKAAEKKPAEKKPAVKKAVEKKPAEKKAADVCPVVRGRWVYETEIEGHACGECSACHKIRVIDNFCPNCGADMRGGSEQ